MFNRIPGTKDILPQETGLWQRIEEIARDTFAIYNYKEVRPPLIEDASLFNRSLGQSSEIIQKQMFLLKNTDGEYALRPEATASIARTYIENNLDKLSGFTKFFYIGPMFRRERPQKGRLRQFHHIGVEAIGSEGPDLDVEIISLADNLLKTLEISGFQIKLNTLGCANDKLRLSQNLRNDLKEKLKFLCDDCKVRFKKNILRILDCKNEACQQIVSNLGIKDSHLCPECLNHFARVKEGLDALKINYTLASFLVRGLDYYTRTVFEISHKDLGAQDALGAGGRYDNLIEELGGPKTGAIGFAFGVERLLLARAPSPEPRAPNLVYLITLGEEAKIKGLSLLDEIRRTGISADTDYENKSLKGSLRKANDLEARFVLILGEDELKKGVVTLKDMKSGEQKEVKQEDIGQNLSHLVGGKLPTYEVGKVK